MIKCPLVLAALLMPAGPMHAQGRDGTVVEENDIVKVKVELDSTLDRFTGRSIIGPKKIKTLAGGGPLGTSDVYFALVRAHPKEADPFFYVRIVYSGYGWTFLNGRLQFLVDGTQQIEITGDDSGAERKIGLCGSAVGCQVSEGLRIPIAPVDLVALSRAHSVELRVVGQDGSLERWFKKDHFAQARALVTRYRLDTLPVPATPINAQ